MHFEEALYHINMHVKKLVFRYHIRLFDMLWNKLKDGLHALLKHLGQANEDGIEAIEIVMDLRDMRVPYPLDLQAVIERCRSGVAEAVRQSRLAIEWSLIFLNAAGRQNASAPRAQNGDSDGSHIDDLCIYTHSSGSDY